MSITRNYQAECKHWQPEFTKVIDGRAVRFRDVCVHEIRMGDVEDPDLMVADPIWRWQQTDAGKFIMEHAVEQPYWTRNMDLHRHTHVYRVMARLSEQNETFWRLKHVDTKN
jgi:hypothetical protein